MKTSVIAILCLFAGYAFSQATMPQYGKLPISIEDAVNTLEVAGDAHQEAFDRYGNDAPWVVIPGQDALWVERYQQIIDLIKVLE